MSRPTHVDELDVYDFDETIYSGDSSLDFYLFCVSRRPWLLAYLPYQCWHLLRLRLKTESRKHFKQAFFIFLENVANLDATIEGFWKVNTRKIKPWYAASDHAADVIISASPEFLLRPICKKFGVRMLIGTHMDGRTGKIDGENCRGLEKVIRLKEVMPDIRVRKAYSDSLADLPLLGLAKEPFIVVGDTVMPLAVYSQKWHSKRHFSLPDAIE